MQHIGCVGIGIILVFLAYLEGAYRGGKQFRDTLVKAIEERQQKLAATGAPWSRDDD